MAALVDTMALQQVQADLRQIEEEVRHVRTALATANCQELIAQLGVVRQEIEQANLRLLRAYAGQCLLSDPGQERLDSLMSVLEKFG